jgi:hypothetical protein
MMTSDVQAADGPGAYSIPTRRTSPRLSLGMLFRGIDAPYSPQGASIQSLPAQVKASDPLGYSMAALSSWLGVAAPSVSDSAAAVPAPVAAAASDATAATSSMFQWATAGWLGNNLLAVTVALVLLGIGLLTLVKE